MIDWLYVLHNNLSKEFTNANYLDYLRGNRIGIPLLPFIAVLYTTIQFNNDNYKINNKWLANSHPQKCSN